MRRATLALAAGLSLLPAAAGAQQITFTPVVNAIAAEEAAAAAAQTPAPAPAFVYSDGYRARLKIHKTASIAMLPLMGLQGILGKKLYDRPTDTVRAWHNGVAWTIGGLFAVNSVTGTWNLIEGRKDPEHRKLRVIHGILMLASDAGFLATAVTNPSEHSASYDARRTTHTTLAVTSISTATVGYLIMLFGRR